MRRIHAAFNWIRQLFLRGKFEREMQGEMQAHIAQQAELNRARGMSAQDALAEARREFGNVAYLQEQSRDARGTRFVDETLRDVRYGVRALLRTPGYTIVAILSLTLGIGVNTAMFSAIKFVMAPSRVSNPETLVSNPWYITYPTWKALASEPGLFSRTVAHSSSFVAISRQDRPALEVNIQLVSDGFFALWEAPVMLGRLLAAGEGQNVGGTPAAVLSYPFWQREFGSDSSVVGRTLRLSNGSVFTIVGVTSMQFAGAQLRIPDIWVPLAARSMLPSSEGTSPIDWFNDSDRQWITLDARLAPGVSFEQARLRVRQVVAHLPTADSSRAPDIYDRLISGDESGLSAKNGPAVAFILAATAMVLLVGCANVANLVLARGVRRRREIAVRLSLGASRSRLVRQLVTECLILASIGGACALAVSVAGLRVLANSSFAQSTIQNAGPTLAAQLTPTSGIVALTFLTALVSALACGLFPALRSTKMDLSSATRDDGAAIGTRLARSKLRTGLVVGQVAFSLVLVTVASVLLRSAFSAAEMDIGFDRDRLVTAEIGATATGYTEAQFQQYTARLRERVASVAGDSNVARGGVPVASNRWKQWVRIAPKEPFRMAARIHASTNYFQVLGIKLVSGRTFSEAEVRTGAEVAVVGEGLARRLWPNVNAVGQGLVTAHLENIAGKDSLINFPALLVVGVAADAQITNIGGSDRAEFYVPSDSGDVIVRNAKPELLTSVVRDAGRVEDANVLLKVSTMNERIASVSRVQMAGVTALYSGALGALALTLSVIGIFGVVAYAVSQRTREIGIRLAIGAQPLNVLRMIIRQGLKPVWYGAILGLALSAGAAQGLRVMLFGVSPIDPVAFVGAVLLVVAAAVLACYLPARRATRIDPVGALRSD